MYLMSLFIVCNCVRVAPAYWKIAQAYQKFYKIFLYKIHLNVQENYKFISLSTFSVASTTFLTKKKRNFKKLKVFLLRKHLYQQILV